MRAHVRILGKKESVLEKMTTRNSPVVFRLVFVINEIPSYRS